MESVPRSALLYLISTRPVVSYGNDTNYTSKTITANKTIIPLIW
jgi:hypothetical protein